MQRIARLLVRTRGAALALALAAGAGAAPLLQAQDLPDPGDGFAWERVGDFPVDADALAFDTEGALWAGGNDLWRLDLSGGFPGTWVVVNNTFSVDRLLPLGPDTLVVNRGRPLRSTDGGATFTQVYDRANRGLYEVPPGHPSDGRILVGDGTAIAYSDDRAASFTASTVPDHGTGTAGGADDFASYPPGTPFAGRVLAAGRWGVNVSDDGGETFRKSALWQALRYKGHEVEIVERAQSPGGVRALLIGADATLPYYRAWASDDGGETWGPEGGVALPEGPPVGPGAWPAGLAALGGGSALAVMARGTVYRTEDAGETWEPVGRAPDISEDTRASAAVVGPDGRLYVGLHRGGPAKAWVYRTGEVVVSSEGGPPEAPESLGLSVRPNPSRGGAEVVVTLSQPAAVEAVLYDALGRRVAVVASGTYAAGAHAARVEAAALPAGVYVVRVTAHAVSGAERGETVLARRLTLVR